MPEASVAIEIVPLKRRWSKPLPSTAKTSMEVQPILKSIQTAGGVLRIEGSKLILEANSGVISQDLKDAIREHKEEIIQAVALSLYISEHSRSQQGIKKGIKSSKYVGVYYEECRGRKMNKKWKACIMLNNKEYNCGRYYTEEEAALAYNRKALELYGKSAKLNIIRGKKEMDKQVISLLPKDVWQDNRRLEVIDVIKRCLEEGIKIPTDWINEYNENTK